MLTTRYILDEAHLKHYDERLKSWASSQSSKTIPSTLYPWTQTEKAGAVTCWPVGGTPLLPTVDFLFTEVPPASGDKGPSNPSTITGVSSVAVTHGAGNVIEYIPLGSTYYGGTLDVASGVMTVTWDVAIITGNETWQKSADSTETMSVFFSDLGLPTGTMSSNQKVSTRFCSHFSYGGASSSLPYFNTWGAASRVYFVVLASDFPDVASFKTWLASEYTAGHPVVLGYLKGTPATVQLTPTEILSLTQPDKYTPRLNTVYTDAQAVQVGYVKSPIREEYELQQAIISQGGSI